MEPPFTVPEIPLSSLVFACAPEDSQEICVPEAVAATIAVIPGVQPVRPLGFTLIGLCWAAWTLSAYEEGLEFWSQLIDESFLAATLLHEVQHADEVVGLANVCRDHTYDVNQYKTLYLLI